MEYPNRKRIRIPEYDYSTQGAYFITVCTANRKPLFRNVGADIIRPENIPELSPCGVIVESGIKQIESNYKGVSVEKYCIMPDHVHLIIILDCTERGRIISAPTISTVVGSMKRWVSRRMGFSVWQKSFYDHVIRNEREHLEIWNYIDGNPSQWLEDVAP